jgi:hypothetical protein
MGVLVGGLVTAIRNDTSVCFAAGAIPDAEHGIRDAEHGIRRAGHGPVTGVEGEGDETLGLPVPYKPRRRYALP